MNTLATLPGPWAALALSSAAPAESTAAAAGGLLVELARLAARSSRLRYLPSPSFRVGGVEREIPHFIFNGPPGGGEVVRLGLFAGIHGDEPEGVRAVLELLRELEHEPALAAGYRLHVYPVCNPSGFAAGTRHAGCGRDLNREFWTRSTAPEVWWLEHELITRRFNGLISLHSDNDADGVYAYVRGALFSKTLARPALAAANRHLGTDRRPQIDGFASEAGVLHQCFPGVLSVPPAALTPRPFEIIFETPQAAPVAAQVRAAKSAVRAILEAYRGALGYQDGI